MNKGYVTYQSDKLIMKKKGSKKVENEYGMPNKNFEIQFEFKTTQKNAALFSIEDGSDSSSNHIQLDTGKSDPQCECIGEDALPPKEDLRPGNPEKANMKHKYGS